MKLTLSQIINAVETIDRLNNILPSGIAFDVAINYERMKPYYVSYQKTFSQIVKEYGEQTEEGWRIPENRRQEYAEKMAELLEKSIDVEINKIPKDGFGGIGVKDALALLFMIEVQHG